MDEFTLIKDYFAPLARGFKGALGLSDDAALLGVPPGKELAVTTDAMTQGVHFLGCEAPGLIARKLLRVNLSDLAAMGAAPLCYFLAVMLPEETDEAWVKDFAAGLAEDQERFGIHLAGGDTTAALGTLSLSLTALGLVDKGKALKRSGAEPGDDIYVSGTLGDSALGLTSLRAKRPGWIATAAMPPRDDESFLIQRYLLPEPRVALGQHLAGLASACIDISDGLAQDMEHICDASGCKAVMEAQSLPISEAARRAIASSPELGMHVFSDGDDYELLFTASPEHTEAIEALGVTRIGHMEEGGGAVLLDDAGQPMPLAKKGYRHFA